MRSYSTLATALATALLLGGCSGGGESVAAIPAQPATAPLSAGDIYTLGDSITFGAQLPDTTSAFPYLLGLRYNRAVHDIAVSGSYAPNVLAQQLPQVHAPCALATLNIGTNDSAALLVSETLQTYISDVTEIVASLQATCQRVLVTTVIANTFPPAVTAYPNYAANRSSINAFLSTLSGVMLIDLNTDVRLHDPANFYRDPGLHPNVTGHIAIASDIEAALR